MKRRSLALFLCMMMVLGTVAHAAVLDEGLVPGTGKSWAENNTLTLVLPEDYQDDLDPKPETGTDPGEEPSTPADPVGVVVDLYMVAEAEDVPGYDAYTYTDLSPTFEGQDLTLPDMDSVTTDEWQEFTWKASELVLTAAENGTPILVNATLELGKYDRELLSGLYLLIPHGKGMTPEQYITTMLGEDGVEHMATLANSADYTYTFQPQLVSLPGQNTTPEGLFDGTWNHDVTAALKPTQELRFGKVTLKKSINRYELGEPATFVFRVTAEKGGETVYENVVGLTFSAETGTEQTVTLDRIPLGATVTAEEIYSGAFYEGGPVTTEPQVLPLEGLELEFHNTRGDDEKRGHGFVNEFTFNGTEWDLKQNGQAPAGGEEG